jgi:hypothetical protein
VGILTAECAAGNHEAAVFSSAFALPKAEVSFLSSWVSSPSAAQAAAKDLWSNGLSPQAEAKVRSPMATEHPDYFHGSYALQKETYGTRSDYKRCYRQQHPDYVQRNAAFVRKWRQRLRSAPVHSHRLPTLVQIAGRLALGISLCQALEATRHLLEMYRRNAKSCRTLRRLGGHCTSPWASCTPSAWFLPIPNSGRSWNESSPCVLWLRPPTWRSRKACCYHAVAVTPCRKLFARR